jgi:RNA polymerase sigma-70 factor (ECF subfamily)
VEYCETVTLAAPRGAFADEAAFDGWVRETQKSLVRFCRQMVDDWAEAEDMAQEAYLRAWEKRGSFKGGCSLLTWQMAIARRVCLDRLRRQKRVKLIPLDERDAAPSPDTETKADVQRALAKLNADDRAVLYLRAGEGLPFEEAGKALGCSAAACRKRYERAKQRFEAAYGGREG